MHLFHMRPFYAVAVINYSKPKRKEAQRNMALNKSASGPQLTLALLPFGSSASCQRQPVVTSAVSHRDCPLFDNAHLTTVVS